MVVPRYDGLVTVFAANLNIREPCRHLYLLLVDSVSDEYDLVIFHECPAYLYCIGNVPELARAVS